MGPGLMLLCLRAVSSYLELLAFVGRWGSDSPGFSTVQWSSALLQDQAWHCAGAPGWDTEVLLDREEPTSNPHFCPKGILTLFFWGIRKQNKTKQQKKRIREPLFIFFFFGIGFPDSSTAGVCQNTDSWRKKRCLQPIQQEFSISSSVLAEHSTDGTFQTHSWYQGSPRLLGPLGLSSKIQYSPQLVSSFWCQCQTKW